MNHVFDETENSAYAKYWAGILSMNKENVLGTLLADDLRLLSSKELCKLFKFLSCFFCCLDRFGSDDGTSPCGE